MPGALGELGRSSLWIVTVDVGLAEVPASPNDFADDVECAQHPRYHVHGIPFGVGGGSPRRQADLSNHRNKRCDSSPGRAPALPGFLVSRLDHHRTSFRSGLVNLGTIPY